MKAKRLTLNDELTISVTISRYFIDALEFCLDKGEGKPAPIASLILRIDEYVPEHIASKYDEGWPTISKAAKLRIQQEAVGFAASRIRMLIDQGKLNEAETRKLLSR